MGYWTKYCCTYCGKIMIIGDEENIEHTKTHNKENK